MAIQGFNFDGDTYKYDYDALENKPDLSTDKTLKVTDKPADAKAVGDAISTLNSKTQSINGSIYNEKTVTLTQLHFYLVICGRGIATGGCLYLITTDSSTMIIDKIYEHEGTTVTFTNDGLNLTVKCNKHSGCSIIDCGLIKL